MLGIKGSKKYFDVIRELEKFQPIKQEIVYKINHTIDERKLKEEEEKKKESLKEMFKNEVVERIKNYLLDLPIGEYRLTYNDVFDLPKSDYNGVEIWVIDNKYRDWTDKLLDRNKKYVKVWRTKTHTPDLEITGWHINDILKFHNQLENIMLLIGKQYGYEPPQVTLTITSKDCECEEEIKA